MRLKAPFPWFGGKSRASSLVWGAMGDVTAYVEPFAGSLAVLLGRPSAHEGHIEIVNDLDAYLANFWRSVSRDPEAVAAHADWPVNEADLFARHSWLVAQAPFRERMRGDPDFFDAKIAGWWVWGLSCWIGGGWCADKPLPNGENPSKQRKRPHLVHAGRGVHGVDRRRPECSPGTAGRGVHSLVREKRPSLSGNGGGVGVHSASVVDQMPDIYAVGSTGVHGRSLGSNLLEWFAALSRRLRRVRVCCGDWSRVLTPAVTVCSHGTVGVFLDPPYSHEERDPSCYAVDQDVSAEVRAWAISHGDDSKLRIVLAGYEGEHEMPASWRVVEWQATGGYARGHREGRGTANRFRERLWLSPSCLTSGQGVLFQPEGVRP